MQKKNISTVIRAFVPLLDPLKAMSLQRVFFKGKITADDPKFCHCRVH